MIKSSRISTIRDIKLLRSQRNMFTHISKPHTTKITYTSLYECTITLITNTDSNHINESD